MHLAVSTERRVWLKLKAHCFLAVLPVNIKFRMHGPWIASCIFICRSTIASTLRNTGRCTVGTNGACGSPCACCIGKCTLHSGTSEGTRCRLSTRFHLARPFHLFHFSPFACIPVQTPLQAAAAFGLGLVFFKSSQP